MKNYWFFKICNNEDTGVYEKLHTIDKRFKRLNDKTVLMSKNISKEVFEQAGINICDLKPTSLNLSSFLNYVFQQGYTIERIKLRNKRAKYIEGILEIFNETQVRDINLKNDLINGLLKEVRFEIIEKDNEIEYISIKQDSLVKDTPIIFTLNGFDNVSINEELEIESLELLSQIK